MADLISGLAERLKGSGVRVLFVECDDERVLRAARRLADEDVCRPALLGDPARIASDLERLGISAEGIELIDHEDADARASLSERYRAINPAFSEKRLAKKMNSPLQHAAMMLKVGDVDCLAAGVVLSTGEVIVAAQQFVGLAEGVETVSSMGYAEVVLPGAAEARWIGMSDCGVVTDPDIAQLTDIACCSAKSCEAVFGEESRVAFVSYSTCGSSDGPSVDRERAALAAVREREPQLKVDGEFQLEVALVPAAAERKLHGRASEVAGQANVLVFPNLDAGNVAVKCIQVFGGFKVCGPVLQGFARPVTDFSRSATADEVFGNVVLCLAQNGMA